MKSFKEFLTERIPSLKNIEKGMSGGGKPSISDMTTRHVNMLVKNAKREAEIKAYPNEILDTGKYAKELDKLEKSSYNVFSKYGGWEPGSSLTVSDIKKFKDKVGI